MMRDISTVLTSIFIAWLLVQTGILSELLSQIGAWRFLGSFFAGMFFVSIFTVAPAVTVLGEIAKLNPAWEVAIFGGLGAVVGDFIIFRFIRDRLASDLADFLGKGIMVKMGRLAKTSYSRWFMFVLGAFIIASPFPDEAGLALMGISKIKTPVFAALSFGLNSLGIFLFVLAIKAVN